MERCLASLVLQLSMLVACVHGKCDVRTEAFGHVQSEDGDYSNFDQRCWLLQPEGAVTVRVSFKSFETELDYDIMYVYDGADSTAPLLSPEEGYSGDDIPSALTSSGGSIFITFVSDFLIKMGGFTFAWTSDNGHLSEFWCGQSCEPAMLTNDLCDAACYNEQCTWDSGDCESTFCNATASCRTNQLGDGTCDPNCINAACSFDYQDCMCSNVIDKPYGFMTDGSNTSSDYESHAHKCWLLQLQGEGVSPNTGPSTRSQTLHMNQSERLQRAWW